MRATKGDTMDDTRTVMVEDGIVRVGAATIPIQGTVGAGGVERAFCPLVQQAIRTRSVNLGALADCACLQEGVRCGLTCGRFSCLLLEDDPERVGAWQLARRSIELEQAGVVQ